MKWQDKNAKHDDKAIKHDLGRVRDKSAARSRRDITERIQPQHSAGESRQRETDPASDNRSR